MRAHLFQEPGGRNLAFAHHRGGHRAATAGGSSRSRKFLKMLPAHFIVGGNFSFRTLRMSAEISSQFGGTGRLERQFHPEDDPLLVAFEDALAIAEIALRVIEIADPFAIEKADARDAFRDGVPVGAGVAIDRGAHPAGNAGQRFQPLQTVMRWQNRPDPAARRRPPP